MIAGGLIVGGIASSAGYVFALWANRRWDIPPRNAAGVTAAELDHVAHLDEKSLPSIWLAIQPILLPVVLISMSAITTARQKEHLSFPAARLWTTIGHPTIALTLAAAVGLLMVWNRPGSTKARFQATVVQALSSGGLMVLTICAGGALGYLFQETDIASKLQAGLPESKMMILPIAFLVTVAVRTSVGSAIVSMITTIGIFGPVALAGHLGFHPVYLALAIGCGSKPILWMNDAGFWIITQMSGMTEAETLKTVSVMMCIMGVVGLLATMAGAWILPMTGR
jgi:gluconate:H+ symporter, GntP family